jgi:2-dehydro-3-deoxy-D-arabinonate dehydratase
MQICKFRQGSSARVGIVDQDRVRPLLRYTLSEILHMTDPVGFLRSVTTRDSLALSSVQLLAPAEDHEVWAAGVTYKRSKVAREEESAGSGASRFYDLVYTAPRPELFFKAPARRVVGPGGEVRIRRDARWSVPEPELALVLSPSLKVVGYTIGNDMSSRDIEGENPLYLPQAKIYDGACALGPVITLAGCLPPPEETTIHLSVSRDGRAVFEGSTHLGMMKRSFEELVGWLGKETTFPGGAILLTGTGVVPPDDFTLAAGDEVTIEIAGIGRLVNRVAR